MTDQANVLRLRTLPKDVGVALAVLVALGLGLLLYLSVDGRTRQYQSADTPFQITYPADWIDAESLQDVMLKVIDPRTDSAFKTALTVESRELDPQSPPTLQTLLDRRVEQRSALTGYHFLSNQEVMVDGEKAMRFEYAYTVQPIDEARRASLPVVVLAREYIVVAQDRTYYISLAAPENEFERASARFDRMIQTVQVS